MKIEGLRESRKASCLLFGAPRRRRRHKINRRAKAFPTSGLGRHNRSGMRFYGEMQPCSMLSMRSTWRRFALTAEGGGLRIRALGAFGDGLGNAQDRN